MKTIDKETASHCAQGLAQRDTENSTELHNQHFSADEIEHDEMDPDAVGMSYNWKIANF